MAYGHTWTGLSEMLVAERGTTDSPLNRKGPLWLTESQSVMTVPNALPSL